MADDNLALQALQAGEPAALAGLFDENADRVYRLALGLLRDPTQAEDIVQETFLKALTHGGQFEGRAKASTWLYRVAYNGCMDRLRQRQEMPLPAEDTNDDIGAPLPQSLVAWALTPEDILMNAQAHDALETAIGHLSDALRAVFILRDIEQLSTEETAEALGISASAVKVRLHRARLALREQLSGFFAVAQASKGGG